MLFAGAPGIGVRPSYTSNRSNSKSFDSGGFRKDRAAAGRRQKAKDFLTAFTLALQVGIKNAAKVGTWLMSARPRCQGLHQEHTLLTGE